MEPSNSDIILVCVDRDGTINLDENYFLGSIPHWREQVEFLPGVIEGIQLLNSLPNAKIVITTNQAGIALSGTDAISGYDFDLLDEKRGREVNQHIIDTLKVVGCRVDGYELCPYVTTEYAKKAAARGRTVNPGYIKDDARCLKPNIGMLEDAAARFGKKLDGIKHKFMIGDRRTDIETGLRANCVSLFIESSKSHEFDDFRRVSELRETAKKDTVFICRDFLEAAQRIRKISEPK